MVIGKDIFEFKARCRKNDYWNWHDGKNETFFCDLFYETSSRRDYAYPYTRQFNFH